MSCLVGAWILNLCTPASTRMQGRSALAYILQILLMMASSTWGATLGTDSNRSMVACVMGVLNGSAGIMAVGDRTACEREDHSFSQ